MARSKPTTRGLEKGTGALPEAPLYVRLVRILKGEIVSGKFPVGSNLPTEARLCRRFKVSRHTVREALRQLRGAGLIVSRRGAGSTVTLPAPAAHYVHAVSSIEELVSYARETRYEIDSSGMVQSDRALARRLDCLEGQRWLRIHGLRFAPGQADPMCWTEVYVHEDFAGIARMMARRPGPIYAWIEDLYGERIARIDQVLYARAVPADLAAPLRVAAHSAAIEVRRTYRLLAGTVAEIAFNLHPADRFRYAMTLLRREPQP
jgi:DNA-binding GntR family transcriptional regulator